MLELARAQQAAELVGVLYPSYLLFVPKNRIDGFYT